MLASMLYFASFELTNDSFLKVLLLIYNTRKTRMHHILRFGIAVTALGV